MFFCIKIKTRTVYSREIGKDEREKDKEKARKERKRQKDRQKKERIGDGVGENDRERREWKDNWVSDLRKVEEKERL